MILTKTASFVLSALLGSSRAGEAFAPFAVHDVSMVSTMMPSHGMNRGAISIPTGVSASGAGTARASLDHQKRSASSSTAPSRFSPEDTDAYHDQDHDQQHHPASAFYFADEDTTDLPPAAQIPSTPAQPDDQPPPAPPEPGGEEAAAAAAAEAAEAAGGNDAFQSAYDRPWRKRARDARARTVFENTQGGFGWEGLGQEGGGDAMRQRASEKEEVVASRRETKKKAISSAALPIVDLVGIVSPLVIIAGMTMVQNAP
eukprot:g11376.t1